MYYSYHNQISSLIKDGHLIDFEIVENWNSISPALILYFDNHRPMPIRKHKWEHYFNEIKILEKIKKYDKKH